MRLADEGAADCERHDALLFQQGEDVAHAAAVVRCELWPHVWQPLSDVLNMRHVDRRLQQRGFYIVLRGQDVDILRCGCGVAARRGSGGWRCATAF